jgi:hypothetical protein
MRRMTSWSARSRHFRIGYTRWADPQRDENPCELATLTRAAFDELRAAAAGLR